ncbi:hypothetical protein [Haloparvum sedimenti]|uniref:hypothetical protein n=1 Tax=Haloparvum sedimenti TaxID=1678448 RepID=UPI00071E945C|nr:hypothetical protein [Haloparvum sedimenti]
MSDDDTGHASAVAAQLRQAEENGDMPESTEGHSVLRTAVDGDRLDASNPLDYLITLALEGKRYDGNWDGDDMGVAKWVVAQWQQEIGWAPDLTPFEPGAQVPRGADLGSCDAVFYESARAGRDGQEVADE